jgi:hypothetical protein
MRLGRRAPSLRAEGEAIQAAWPKKAWIASSLTLLAMTEAPSSRAGGEAIQGGLTKTGLLRRFAPRNDGGVASSLALLAMTGRAPSFADPPGKDGGPSLRAAGEAIQGGLAQQGLDCFVASLLAMTGALLRR